MHALLKLLHKNKDKAVWLDDVESSMRIDTRGRIRKLFLHPISRLFVCCR
jgi:hypothetical protein